MVYKMAENYAVRPYNANDPRNEKLFKHLWQAEDYWMAEGKTGSIICLFNGWDITPPKA